MQDGRTSMNGTQHTLPRGVQLLHDPIFNKGHRLY